MLKAMKEPMAPESSLPGSPDVLVSKDAGM